MIFIPIVYGLIENRESVNANAILAYFSQKSHQKVCTRTEFYMNFFLQKQCEWKNWGLFSSESAQIRDFKRFYLDKTGRFLLR